jgi:hypothetical protein
MQHAVGAPLPPPQGHPHGQPQGQPQERFPTQPQGRFQGSPGGPDGYPLRPANEPPAPPRVPPPPLSPPPAPPVPPAPPGAPHTGRTGAGAPGGPGVPQAPGHRPQAAPRQPSGPPPDSTGHVQLPPGGLVPVPAPPPADSGTGAATLAVLLIGPAGAGKTTVARHWAQSRRAPTAHISLDDVREWVCSGFADPQTGWNDHSEAQYRLARRTCGFAARNFLANGISCILDDAVFPDRPVVGLGGWKRHVGPGLLPVVLLPGLEVVLERNAERSGNRRLSDEEVAGIHGRMAGWYGSGLPIIDNSTYDVETTARVLDDVLARSIASPPAW